MPERPTERHKAYKLGEVVPHTDLSTKVPVRKGYTFAGWSLASGEGNAVLANDEKVIMGETGVIQLIRKLALFTRQDAGHGGRKLRHLSTVLQWHGGCYLCDRQGWRN